MVKTLKMYLGFTVLIPLFLQCHGEIDKLDKTLKFHSSDPFKESMVQSQSFALDGKVDNVVEGEMGTILVLPKGCFLDPQGKVVTDSIVVELAEALSLDQMVLSNLTTISNGKLLETDGMIYLNATSNGEQLGINRDIPVYIQIPTEKRIPGMMAYRGIRDTTGDMNWVDPQDLEDFLVPVDIHLLNFYPEGFEEEVIKGLPFKNHKVATNELIDSLYYSLSVSDGSELYQGFAETNYNEPYYNQEGELVEDKYNRNSSKENEKSQERKVSAERKAFAEIGIDPAIIKTIKSEKFQNTLISTPEFETRLQTIFKTCRNDILEIYINNLDKDLWELDSMAAAALGEHPRYHDFYNFSKQGLTNVKGGFKYADLLQGYYQEQLKQIKSDLEETKKELARELQEGNERARQNVKEYRESLNNRERYRMETYGFKWSSTGWINIDRGTNPKNWGLQKLEMMVDGGNNYDRVYVYVVYTSIKSLYRLNSSNNEVFFVGNDQAREMLMPKKSSAVGIAIAYKQESPYLSIAEFETGTEETINLTLEKSTSAEITMAIKAYDDYGQGNRIDRDLDFMKSFAEEKKRQDQLKKESQFIEQLWHKAFPCFFFE